MIFSIAMQCNAMKTIAKGDREVYGIGSDLSMIFVQIVTFFVVDAGAACSCC